MKGHGAKEKSMTWAFELYERLAPWRLGNTIPKVTLADYASPLSIRFQ